MSSLITLSSIALVLIWSIAFADALRLGSLQEATAIACAFFAALSIYFLIFRSRRSPFILSLLFVLFTTYTLFFLPKPSAFPMPSSAQWLAGEVEEISHYDDYSRLIISLPTRMKVRVWSTSTALPQEGETIQFRAKLNAPTGLRNEGVWDRRRQLLREGIVATGKLVEWKGGELSFPSRLDHFRSHMLNRVTALLDRIPDPEVKGFLVALTLGRVDAMPELMKKRWQEMGIYHLVVVSGLHLGMFYLVFYYLGYGLSRWSKTAWQRFARQDLAVVMGMIGIVIPMGIYPSTPSLNRAFWSLLLWSICRLGRIPMTAGRLLMALSIGFLLLDPRVLFDLSFQLSFLCLISIAAIALPFHASLKSFFNQFSKYYMKIVFILVEGLLASAAVFLGTLPLTGYLQGKIHFFSIIANIFLIPLFSFIITPLWLGLFWIGFYCDSFLRYTSNSLAVLFQGIDWVYDKTDIDILNPFFTPTWGLFYWGLLLLSIVVVWRRLPYARLGVGCFWIAAIGLVWAWPHLPTWSVLKISFFDVGQGESYLITTPSRKRYLIDGGGYAGSKSDIGRHVLVPALRAQGVDRLRAVLLSHPDADHYSGLESVASIYDVDEFWWNGDRSDAPSFMSLETTLREEGVSFRVLSQETGPLVLDDNVTMEVLYPHRLLTGSDNDYSIVARLRYRNFSFLMTGDIEAAAESTLVHQFNADDLNSVLLKVPHHGSKTSSAEAFLDRVNPILAVASVGLRNRFGHPHPSIIERYHTRQIPLFRTDEGGQIIIKTDGLQMVDVSSCAGVHEHYKLSQ